MRDRDRKAAEHTEKRREYQGEGEPCWYNRRKSVSLSNTVGDGLQGFKVGETGNQEICRNIPFCSSLHLQKFAFFFFTFSSYLRTLASPPSPLPPPPVELPTGGGTTEVRLSSQTPRRASHSPFPGETSASQAVAVQLSPSEAPTRPPCFFALPPPPGRALYPNSVKSSAAAAAVQHRAVRVGGGAQQGFPTASCSSQSKPLNH